MCARRPGTHRAPVGSLSCFGRSLSAPTAPVWCLVAHRHADLRHPTEDGGHRSRCGRCWCGVAGGAREAAAFATAAGLAALDLMALGVFQHRNSISAHWAVRETAVSFFRLYFERGRGTPQRARLVRSALVGGEEKKWRSRVKVKSRTRALALLVLVRGSARQTAARQNARHRRISVQ